MCTTNATSTTSDLCNVLNPTTTIIDPITVTPITSTEGAANNYSISYVMKKNLTNGTDEATFSGQLDEIDGDLVDQMMDLLVSIVGDMIRSSAIATYTDPTGFDDSVTLVNESTFRNFFLNDGAAVNYPTTSIVGKKISHIVDSLYNIFTRIKYHIETMSEITLTCINQPYLLDTKITSCFFEFELIYN